MNSDDEKAKRRLSELVRLDPILHNDFYRAAMFLLREEGGELDKEGRVNSGYGHGPSIMSMGEPTPEQKRQYKHRRDALIDTSTDIIIYWQERYEDHPNGFELAERAIRADFDLINTYLQDFAEREPKLNQRGCAFLIDEALSLGSGRRYYSRWPWTEPQFRFYLALKQVVDNSWSLSADRVFIDKTSRGALSFAGSGLSEIDFDVVRRRLRDIYREGNAGFERPIHTLIEQGIFLGSRGKYGRQPTGKGPYGDLPGPQRKKIRGMMRFLRTYDV